MGYGGRAPTKKERAIDILSKRIRELKEETKELELALKVIREPKAGNEKYYTRRF